MKRLILSLVLLLGCMHSLSAQYFVLSVRPDFILWAAGENLAAMSGKPAEADFSTFGGSIESGVILLNGIPRIILTASGHYGFTAHDYFGGFFNIGIFPEWERFRLGLGGSFGYLKISHHIDVIKDGEIYDRYTDYSSYSGGLFIKWLFGRTHNLEFAANLLFGRRKSHFVVRDGDEYRYDYHEGSTDSRTSRAIGMGFGFGYTLTKKREKA